MTEETYEVTVTDSYGCTITLQVILSSEVGMDENGELKISVFPNPSLGVFNISIPNGIRTAYTVMDISGRILFSNESSAMNTTLDLSAIESGIYILNITQESKSSSIRIVVQ